MECCYARQTKFWVRDPDNNLWEIYVVDEDLEHRGMGQVPEAQPDAVPPLPMVSEPPRDLWQHQLGAPLPSKVFALDNSTHEVRLRGSYNAEHTPGSRQQLVAEVFRILIPCGTVSLHLLTGNASLAFPPGTLPGPAAAVTHVPAMEKLLSDISAAGFEGAQLTNYGSRPCFTHAGVELRETMLLAKKPATDDQPRTNEVVYLGPLALLRDDADVEYRRGERITVSAAKAQELAAGPLANSFACLEKTAGACLAK